jgi:hypothetical protein
MVMAHVKRTSYTSKSILTLLEMYPIQHESQLISSKTHEIYASIFILLCSISIWAASLFFVLSLCYYFRSGILLQDLNSHRLRSQMDLHGFINELDKQFQQLTYHCWIVTSLYLVVLIICLFIVRTR